MVDGVSERMSCAVSRGFFSRKGFTAFSTGRYAHTRRWIWCGRWRSICLIAGRTMQVCGRMRPGASRSHTVACPSWTSRPPAINPWPRPRGATCWRSTARSTTTGTGATSWRAWSARPLGGAPLTPKPCWRASKPGGLKRPCARRWACLPWRCGIAPRPVSLWRATALERSRCITAGRARRWSLAPRSRPCGPIRTSMHRWIAPHWRCCYGLAPFPRRTRSTRVCTS